MIRSQYIIITALPTVNMCAECTPLRLHRLSEHTAVSMVTSCELGFASNVVFPVQMELTVSLCSFNSNYLLSMDAFDSLIFKVTVCFHGAKHYFFTSEKITQFIETLFY